MLLFTLDLYSMDTKLLRIYTISIWRKLKKILLCSTHIDPRFNNICLFSLFFPSYIRPIRMCVVACSCHCVYCTLCFGCFWCVLLFTTAYTKWQVCTVLELSASDNTILTMTCLYICLEAEKIEKSKLRFVMHHINSLSIYTCVFRWN